MTHGLDHRTDLVGKILAPYRLARTMGWGSSSTVYKAQDLTRDKLVAIKVFNTMGDHEQKVILQFNTEISILRQVQHDNIMPLLDHGCCDGVYYLVMPWLSAGSLRDVLKQKRLNMFQIVKLIKQIASALTYLHTLNIVHRDIKPENILLDQTGNAMLVDFGITVDLNSLEHVPRREGSPDYFAPEQLVEQIISPQGDIYSLGIMLYELLTSRRPFRATSISDLIMMHLYNPVPSLYMERPDLPAKFDDIIWKATAKQPERRYQRVFDLATDFENAVLEYGVSECQYQYPCLSTPPTEWDDDGQVVTRLISVS